MPTPHPERPRYRVVAEELRRRIESGAIAPGQLLPSETVLLEEFGVSRGTVREAIAVLRSEGMVVTEHGRGSYARPSVPVRSLRSNRYRREGEQIAAEGSPATSFTQDHGIGWSAYQLDKLYREVPASPTVAELFGVHAGTMLLERRFVFRADGVPQQMSTSCYLLDLVTGTPVADPENEPWPGGNIAQLHSLGITVTKIRERVRARMPLADEAEALRIPSGVPVLAVTRQTYERERVVEVAVDIVLPADRTELVYDIDLT